MKLPIQQLINHLKKKLELIYLITGDELLLTQEAVADIRHVAVAAEFSERILISADNTSEWEKQFQAHIHDLSLLSSKRIIEIIFLQKLSQKQSTVLQHYAEKPSDDILLIIRAAKLDTKTEQAKWFQAFEKNIVFVPLWPITPEQLPNWILQRAKKNNLILTQSAAILLAEKVEGNLLAASQEIEKLCLLQLTDAIDDALLKKILSDEAHFNLFDLVESVIKGTHARSLRILDHLKAEGTEPTLILWALTREIRMLAEFFQQREKGITLPALFKQFRIWEKRQASIQNFLRTHTLKDCFNLLSAAANIDRVIKGALPGNVWEKLERWILLKIEC